MYACLCTYIPVLFLPPLPTHIRNPLPPPPTCRTLVEIGRDEDEELLEDGAVVEDEEPSDVDNDDDNGK